MVCGVFREFCINPGFCETEAEWGGEACAQCEAAQAQQVAEARELPAGTGGVAVPTEMVSP